MSGVLMSFGAVMVRLISVVTCFTSFCVSYPNESKGTVGFGSTKGEIVSPIY